MMYWFLKGGWVMWPILISSCVALAIAIWKITVFWSIRLDVPSFCKVLFKLLNEKKYQEALQLCQKSGHPIARALLRGLETFTQQTGSVAAEIEIAGLEAIGELDRGLKALATVISILPMLGFLGTICGLIQAFQNWEKLGSNVSVESLAGGIYAAMITTAAGLILAIPYFIVYNYFVSRVERLANDLTRYSREFLALLKQPL